MSSDERFSVDGTLLAAWASHKSPLVRRMIAHLANTLSRLDGRNTLVGEPRELRLPAETTRVEITAPSGKRIDLDLGDRTPEPSASFVETHTPGHYRVASAASGPLEPLDSENFVVNVDTSESNLVSASVEEAQIILGGAMDAPSASNPTLLDRARSLGGLGGKDALVMALLFAMVVAFLVESILGRSRV